MKKNNIDGTKHFCLSHQQLRIWYIENIFSKTPMYNICAYSVVKGKLDFGLVEKAIQTFISENEGCRIQICMAGQEPMQYIKGYEEEEIPFYDFSVYENSMEEFHKWVDKIVNTPFQLLNKKLYSFYMFKVDEQYKGYLCNIHHIISDGWSMNLLSHQISENYTMLVQKEYGVEERPSYVEYLQEEREYLQSNRFLKEKKFWIEQFQALNEEEFFKYSYDIKGVSIDFKLDTCLTSDIKKFVKEKQMSLGTFFIALYYLYEYKDKNREQFTIGTPIYNRINRKQRNIFGLFTSNMPFRMRVNGEETIQQFLRRAKIEYGNFLKNQRYPYDILVNDIGLINKGYNQLFNVCVNYYSMNFENSINGEPVQNHQIYSGSQVYDMQMVIKEFDEDRITLTFDYNQNFITEHEVKVMYRGIIALAQQVLMEEKQCKELSLITQKELDDELVTYNNTKKQYPVYNSILDLFEEQVIQNPNNIAVSMENNKVTYSQLNKEANRLARYIEKKTNKEIVSIIFEHSIETVISILAVMKAGKAYLPLDYSMPEERILYIMEEAQVDLFLTNYDYKNSVIEKQVVKVNDLDLSGFSDEELIRNRSAEDLAYIIYTSGSSGVPKGVMIQQKNLINYIYWANSRYCKLERDVFPLFTSLAFDLTVTSIFTPLIGGNEIRVYANDEHKHPIYRILEENVATVVKLTPAHLKLLKDMKFENSSVKTFIVGGEDLKVSVAEAITENFGGDIAIYNEYGPTEATVGCMIYCYSKKDKDLSVPIGLPIANSRIYILNDDLSVCPKGRTGELYIAGAGVTLGYMKNSKLTEERFVDDPFVPGERMYQSGDLAVREDDGTIVYKGRKDFQVKINGYRVELGEIEENIGGIEGIKDVCVCEFDQVLFAYVVKDKEVKIEKIKSILLKKLPPYMIPRYILELDSIPLNRNGKVDRKQLEAIPLPETDEPAKKDDAVYSENEKVLLKIVAQLLDVQEVELTDNFYYIGGDSIKAIQLSNKLLNENYSLKVKDILSYPEIKDMAAQMIKQDNNKNSHVCMEGTLYPTAIMERFINSGMENLNYYNQSVMLDVKDEVSEEELNSIIEKLVEYHDGLRLNYNAADDKFFYNSRHLKQKQYVKTYDLSWCVDLKNEIDKVAIKNQESFDIQNDLLLKTCLLKTGENKQKILMIAHHLVIDGVSWRIIVEDMNNMMSQIRDHKEISLPSKTSSIDEWTSKLKQYTEALGVDRVEFWNDIVKKEDCTLLRKDGNATARRCKKIVLDKSVSKEMFVNSSSKYNTKISELLIAALILQLNKQNGGERFTLELEGHGREDVFEELNLSRTVGWFTNIYLAAFDVEGLDLEDTIIAVKEQLRSLPQNGLEYSILNQYNKLEKNNTRHVRFNYLGTYSEMNTNQDFQVEEMFFEYDVTEKNTVKPIMEINCIFIKDSLHIMLHYNDGEYSSKKIDAFLDGYKECLKEVIEHCESSKKRLTPSDFDLVSISQEELDYIIGYSKNKFKFGDFI